MLTILRNKHGDLRQLGLMFFSVILGVGSFLFALKPSAAAPVKRSLICHETTAGEKTRTVALTAIDEHLAHGDYLGACAEKGDRTSLGDGYMETYVQYQEDGTPDAIGIAFSQAALFNAPQMMADGNNCWDVNGDGQLTMMMPMECIGGHERILFFPPMSRTIPFKWMLMNWNPMGHEPEGIYSVPHFDFHFYTMDYFARNMIRPGPCALLVNCDDFARGVAPFAEGYMPADYVDLGAVEARMGNHLLDSKAPELQPGGQFKHTFVYGAYDSELIFWEPMITRAYLFTEPSSCFPIKQPSKFSAEGYYPQEYCIRYYPARDEYRVSLESFRFRAAN